MSRQAAAWFRASKNAWYATIDGRKVSLGVQGKANRKVAMEAWHELIANGKPEPKPIATVQAIVDGFLSDAQGRVSPNRMRCYRLFLLPFAKRYGNRQADLLRAAEAEAYSRKASWSDSTRNAFLTALVATFHWAERAGMIGSNPLRHVHKPPQASRGLSALLSAEQHGKLCEHADAMFRAFLELLWLTGARPGEIAGLRAEEIDLVRGQAVLTSHKTAHLGKSRCLFLGAEAIAVIKSMGKSEGLLFLARFGGGLTAVAIAKRLRRLCVKAGVKHTIPYAYHHSFATQALANGVPDAQVAALLGHAGTAMLHKHYSHLTSQSQVLREALARVR